MEEITNLTRTNYPLAILLDDKRNITLLNKESYITFHDGLKYWTMPVEVVVDILRKQEIIKPY